MARSSGDRPGSEKRWQAFQPLVLSPGACVLEDVDCSPKQWIRRQRLTAAMERLAAADGRVSVRAISLGCGYQNMGLFSADFKRQDHGGSGLGRRD
jgi:hypothetical protein